MGKKVVLDEECCVGCGTCEELCPEVFQMDEDGEKATVVQPNAGDRECVEEAVETCPEECISVED